MLSKLASTSITSDYPYRYMQSHVLGVASQGEIAGAIGRTLRGRCTVVSFVELLPVPNQNQDRQTSLMWFIRQADGTESGPFTEQHIRAWVYRSDAEQGWLKKGSSDWRSATEVRQKFEELRVNGTYLSDGKDVFGPFTTSRAEQLVKQSDKKFTHIRTGNSGDWNPVGGSEPFQDFSNMEFPEIATADVNYPPPLNFNGANSSVVRTGVALTRIPDRFRRYIQDGETVLYASNPSENARILSMIFAGAAPGISLFLFVLGALLARDYVTLFIGLITGLLVVAFFVYLAHLHWKHRYYIITSSRTIVSQGIFNVAVRIVFNQNIQMISVNTGMIDRWLDLNTVELSTAGSGGGATIFAFFPGMSSGNVQLRWVADAPYVVSLIST